MEELGLVAMARVAGDAMERHRRESKAYTVDPILGLLGLTLAMLEH